MKILLIHLSDIHLKTDRASNKILDRVEKIAKSVSRAVASSRACFIVLSGDIAFSGNTEQYDLAYEFIEQLRKALLRVNALIEIHVVAVPGNHDCNFALASGMREFALSSISSKSISGINKDVVREMTNIQQPFFDFLTRIANYEDSYEALTRLYYEYKCESVVEN